MTAEVEVTDELYQELDLWFGGVVRAFYEIMDPDPGPLTEQESFYDLWKHDIKIGMGVACTIRNCEHCKSQEQKEKNQ